jgi:hypothetical protein
MDQLSNLKAILHSKRANILPGKMPGNAKGWSRTLFDRSQIRKTLLEYTVSLALSPNIRDLPLWVSADDAPARPNCG